MKRYGKPIKDRHGDKKDFKPSRPAKETIKTRAETFLEKRKRNLETNTKRKRQDDGQTVNWASFANAGKITGKPYASINERVKRKTYKRFSEK